MSYRTFSVLTVALTLGLATASFARADDTPAPATNSAEAREKEANASFVAAMEAATRGGSDVRLLGQATLKLPDGFVFVPREIGRAHV